MTTRDTCSADDGRAYRPAKLGPLTLRNRLTRTAAFEGMSPAGEPAAELVEHHRAMAAGGVGLTTVAYCSVSPEGRTYGHQLWMRPAITGGLRRLTDAVHAEGAAAAIQLGHAGYFASPTATGTRPIGPSRLFNTYGLSWCRAMSAADIERATDDFVRAAELARAAGFDAVELHAGHGYLLSQFLSPFTNRRRDRWGGSLEHRLRLPLQVIQRVRDALGAETAVIVKMNMRDGFPGGLDMAESLEVAGAFEAAGATALVLSGGFVSKTPFYMLRGPLPVRQMVAVQPGVLRKVGLMLFGRLLVDEYPYQELFFLEDAEQIRRVVGLPLVLVGGIASADAVATAMGRGFEFIAMGRALIMDPDLPRKMMAGEATRSACDHCNHCIAEMDRGGVRCPYAEQPTRQSIK